MTYQPHAAAILARLAAAPGSPSLVVYDGRVPDGAVPPYALVYFAYLTQSAEVAPDKVPLSYDSDVLQVDAYVHSVGANAQASRAVATRVRTQLLNWRATVTGRVCVPMRHTENVPPARDESTGVLVLDSVDVYRLVTVPA